MMCTSPSGSVWMRVALKPLGNSVVGLVALVIKVYFWPARGNANTGLALSWHCSCVNDWHAASGSSPERYLESYCVSLNSGAAIIAKSQIWFWKMLQSLMNDLIDLISVGGLALLIALSLAFPSLIPSGAKVNPRYETWSFRKKHFSRLIFRCSFAAGLVLDAGFVGACHECQCVLADRRCR